MSEPTKTSNPVSAQAIGAGEVGSGVTTRATLNPSPGRWLVAGPIGHGTLIITETGLQIAVAYGPTVNPQAGGNARVLTAASAMYQALAAYSRILVHVETCEICDRTSDYCDVHADIVTAWSRLRMEAMEMLNV